MLQVSAVEEHTYGLLKRLMQEPLFDGTRLVGGTSLAMFDRAIIYFGDVNTEAIENIKMIGADMDWDKIESRIVKMTNKPDSVFRSLPL